MRLCAGLVVSGIMLWLSGVAAASEIDWSEAVTRLTAERVKAIECVSLLKKHADIPAIAKGEVSYDKAKSQMDAVIDKLSAALGEDNASVQPADLEAGIVDAVTSRREFCATVEPFISKKPGEKNIFLDIMQDTIEPSIAAVRAIFASRDSGDLLARKTIQTQLEAAKWPGFDKISAAQ